MKQLRTFILMPLSWLYLMLTEIRNLCFDLSLFKSVKLPVPVISVGNLSVGGTGKTPFAIALCDALKAEFSHIAVISRGYGRQSKGAKVVSLKGEIRLNVAESGDEAVLIALRCPFISVVVAEKRLEGWNLIKEQNVDLVILDDAFQHRWIDRDLNILLMDGHHPIDKDALLPLGRLREAKYQMKRADLLCITKKQLPYKTSHLKAEAILDASKITYHFSKKIDKTADYEALSSIAKPQLFEASLKKLGINIKAHHVFKDHHRYKASDLIQLDEKNMITTEKDAVKLNELSFKPIQLQLRYDLNKELLQKVWTFLNR